jgi:hypothetical protein
VGLPRQIFTQIVLLCQQHGSRPITFPDTGQYRARIKESNSELKSKTKIEDEDSARYLSDEIGCRFINHALREYSVIQFHVFNINGFLHNPKSTGKSLKRSTEKSLKHGRAAQRRSSKRLKVNPM